MINVSRNCIDDGLGFLLGKKKRNFHINTHCAVTKQEYSFTHLTINQKPLVSQYVSPTCFHFISVTKRFFYSFANTDGRLLVPSSR